MEQIKVKYDEEFDDLYVFKSDRKADFSVNLDELVIDIDSNNNISGIEIMDAANTISQFTPERFSKEKLKNITRAEIITRAKGNAMMVMMMLYYKEKLTEHKVPITIAMPTVR